MDQLLQNKGLDYFSIEARIDQIMKGFSGGYAVYASDFKTQSIEINSDSLWETASCIKVGILSALFAYLEERKIDQHKKLAYTQSDFVRGSGILRSLSIGLELSLIDLATLMIIVSDNIATNMIINFMGLDYINQYFKQLGFTSFRLHHTLDFTKYSDLGGFTAKEYGQLFQLILKGEIHSEADTACILEILSKQHYNTFMTRLLPKYLLDSENTGDEEYLKIYSKSGSLDGFRNDGGIISTPYGDFICVILTRDFADPLYHSDHEVYDYAPKISALLYNHFITKKGSF